MIDCHIHYADSLSAERLNRLIDRYHIQGIVLLCIPKGDGTETIREVFAFQRQCGVPVYIFGNIRRELYNLEDASLADSLAEEAGNLMKMGCRGIKMLEGKPDVRKKYRIPDFDSRVWEKYWEKLEREHIPLFFHVNDPEEFWDADRVTEAAKTFGWFYDETYVNNEDQYRQILTVLERHPGLKVLFPHFFFLSGQLERLADILNRYKNVMIDITPGVELYYNLSAQIDEARKFFERFQERICYGTDIGARQIISTENIPLSMEESEARIRLVTDFLDKKGAYVLKPDGYYIRGKETKMNGLGLPEEIRTKVYRDNILRFISRKH